MSINFKKLANSGFYEGIKFHRVIPGFMAQGGCPNSKDGAFGMAGTGGPGWAIECETDAPKQIHKRGSISMAHAGVDTGGSQFFICFVPCPHLDGVHTVFGAIEEDDNDEGIIEILYERDENFHIINIYDSGINFEDKNILFEPFKSTKTKGNGLGLALSLEIIQAHNGKIELSLEKKGFKIYIPNK